MQKINFDNFLLFIDLKLSAEVKISLETVPFKTCFHLDLDF